MSGFASLERNTGTEICNNGVFPKFELIEKI